MLKNPVNAACISWFFSFGAWADEAVNPSKTMNKSWSTPDLLSSVLVLMFVLAIFFVIVWLFRKSGGLSLLGKGQLSIISGLSLGMREKLVLVKVGEKQLLLGVTAGRIDKLLELEGEQRLFLTQTNEKDSSLFSEKLSQLMQGKTDA
jgi:flagellar protein FliO/FliZ